MKRIAIKSILFFVFAFLLDFFCTKYFGNGTSYTMNAAKIEQISWKEAISQIHSMLLLSFIISLILFCVLWYQDIQKKKKEKH